MTKLFEILGTFFAGTTLIVYICIFLGKILEVTLCTLRIVLINRGERAIGALLALIEITLWLIIAGNVLSNYQRPVENGCLRACVFIGQLRGKLA